MKKALLLFWHGIGDMICLTPALRELHRNGFHCDILCQEFVIRSQVMKNCPYVTLRALPITVSPSDGGQEGHESKLVCMETFERMAGEYDGAVVLTGVSEKVRGAKVADFYDRCMAEMKLKNHHRYSPLDVFIGDDASKAAKAFAKRHYPDGFVFKHTCPQRHPAHNWEQADRWIKKRWPNIPIFDSDQKIRWKDINVTFALAREAKHRVLASSVFVHACDAMNVQMDMVNYGRDNIQGWPDDPRKIKIMRRSDASSPRYSFNGGKTWSWEKECDKGVV